jgi:membrane protein implicated in regulation of membrane protease activity
MIPESAPEIALYAWLTAGALMLAVEALGAPGVGFLFAGIGSVCVGILLSFGIIAEDAWLNQGVAWGLATAISALLLYKPLKRWRSEKADHYSNMLGTTATVEAPGLQPGIEGQARWSGAIMRARLAEGVNAVDEGHVLRVVGVEGTLLILG